MIRPALLAAGLGIFWFAVYQDGNGEIDAPMWGYTTAIGVRVVADVVGAWILVAALQLAIAFAKFGLVYVRSLWMTESR